MKHIAMRINCIVAAFVLCAPLLQGQITFTITPPQLVEGWAKVEGMIADAADSMIGSFEDTANQLLERPRFMGSFIRTNAQTGLTASGLPFMPYDTLDISLGISAGIQATPFSAETFGALSSLTQDSDLYVGASAQGINLQSAIDLGILIPGLEAGLSFSLFESASSELSLQFLQAGGRVAWRFLEPPQQSADVQWTGIRLEGGMSYASNSVSTVLELDTMEQVISFDFDGAGPFAPISIPLSLQPTINAGIFTSSTQGIFQISSGIVLGDFFGISAGTGLSFYHAEGHVTVNLDEEITVGGALANLIVEGGNPGLIVGGTASKVSTDGLQPYLFLGLGLNGSGFRIELPVYYSFGIEPVDTNADGILEYLGEGFSAALMLGVSL